MENPENLPLKNPEEPEVLPDSFAPLPEELAETVDELVEISPAEPEKSESAEGAPLLEEETPVKEESRARLFFRKLIRWTAGLLIIFGLGFITALFTLYYPKINELKAARNEVQEISGTISDLETEISDLELQYGAAKSERTDIESAYQDSLDQQMGLELQIFIQQARLDVANAQISLFEENPSQAKLHLESTPETLDKISGMLPSDQQDVVNPMKSRLELALGEVDSDPQTAIDDLTILAKNLLELELSLLVK